MLTYIGKFDKDAMIVRARGYIPAFINRNNPTEAEVPFKCLSTNVVGYMQFALLGGNWVFVRTRNED